MNFIVCKLRISKAVQKSTGWKDGQLNRHTDESQICNRTGTVKYYWKDLGGGFREIRRKVLSTFLLSLKIFLIKHWRELKDNEKFRKKANEIKC